jgi:uncharacterized protein with von Willebrand factor type A (vWA) domain
MTNPMKTPFPDEIDSHVCEMCWKFNEKPMKLCHYSRYRTLVICDKCFREIFRKKQERKIAEEAEAKKLEAEAKKEKRKQEFSARLEEKLTNLDLDKIDDPALLLELEKKINKLSKTKEKTEELFCCEGIPIVPAFEALSLVSEKDREVIRKGLEHLLAPKGTEAKQEKETVSPPEGEKLS